MPLPLPLRLASFYFAYFAYLGAFVAYFPVYLASRGLKAGEIAFDLPPVRVTEQALRDLYASENGPLPLQGDEPFVLPTRGLGRDAGRRKLSSS